ncbi:histone deacetylase [Isosphaeraceae bacterium EP7]
MKAFYCDEFVIELPPTHRFPMIKYAMLRRRIVEAGLVPEGSLLVPHAATDVELCRAHAPDYVRRVAGGLQTEAEVREMGFPWSRSLVERSRRSSGATIEAARAAFEDGVAVNLAGGTHHAHADKAAGYCIFNDSAVAARAMQAEGRARRVVVIDTDVHQGDGTASILAGDPTVFTFSIHGAKNYPMRKQPSDLDVNLPDGTDDGAYLDALERGVRRAIDRSRADLAIMLAGADPFEGDTLGRLKVTKAGLAARDRIVLDHCRAAGLPVAISMAGGYAKHVEDTVDIHYQTVQAAAGLAASFR